MSEDPDRAYLMHSVAVGRLACARWTGDELSEC